MFAKTSANHTVDGRACAIGICVYLLSEILLEWSTVDDTLNKGIATRFVSLLTTSSIPEHCLALALVFFLARDRERYASLIELRKCGFSTSIW